MAGQAEAVLAEARPGARVADLQDLAQGIAEDAGYGAHYWPTGFGHGIGTNIAELPSLHWKSETVLQPGHVFALEPMIFIQGLGCGVMEDQVLVTDTGALSLPPPARRPGKGRAGEPRAGLVLGEVGLFDNLRIPLTLIRVVYARVHSRTARISHGLRVAVRPR
ncbi:M24 family metallopeptidase [Streptomyces sp. NPDC004728]|uniref:M24 family metallopeptidase n=1 Tax=Streptomyces sp. NPDC004728 TaxID=3154289 RepID=UPI0033A8FA24